MTTALETMTPAAARVENLFRRAWGRKGESHWVLCLSSYLMRSNGSVPKMAQEYNLDPQTIHNYSKTYWLYTTLREWLWAYNPRYGILELRELRRDVHYSNWLKVAERVFHEDTEKRIDVHQALDFLRAGTDTPARTFSAIVGGNELTRTKAYGALLSGVKKALTFPMPRKEKRILMKARAIAEKRGQP